MTADALPALATLRQRRRGLPRRRWRFGLLLALLASVLPAAASAESKAFQRGVAAYDRGDYTAALATWLPLAEAGDMAAQRNVAHLYRKGLGVPADPVAAANWYGRAATAGLAGAQVNLALLYMAGAGVPRNDEMAVYWLDRAARQGHILAMSRLGQMYADGRGVWRSEAKARLWLARAAALGSEEAADVLQRRYGLAVRRAGDARAPQFPAIADRPAPNARFDAVPPNAAFDAAAARVGD